MSNTRQIDPGTYHVRQGGSQVGAVWVTAGPALDTTVEHWVLFPNFVSPSWTQGGGSADDMVVRAVNWQSIVPGATTTRPNGIGDLSDFLAIMQAYASGQSGTFRYHHSDNEAQDGIPEP